MKLFIDTANIEEIREAYAMGVISGVTTNPSLVAREGGDFRAMLEEITALVDGPISAEVISLDTDGMVAEAIDLAKIHKNIVIKIPMTAEGLAAVKILADQGIRTNVTLIFTANQALLAARAGAAFVSPFVGRLDDIGEDGIALVSDISQLFALHDIDTEIIAASIRSPLHVTQAALVGSDIATLPFKVIKSMLEHQLTSAGIEKFLADWATIK